LNGQEISALMTEFTAFASHAPAQASSHAGLHVQVRSASPVRLDAAFDCAPGELVALVGASGSGKTTLLRTIAGLHASADLQGQVRSGAQLWMDSAQHLYLPPQTRRVGLVFQHYALFPHLSAIKNVALCVDNTGANGLKDTQNDAEELARQWLHRLGLGELLARKPHELSGGQQQRVALARAMVRIAAGQGVLLLDEPFSAVDAPMRQVLYRELAQLRQSLHVPIVLVTHDLQEARRLADRIVIIDGGQSLQSGTPAHVLRSPRNARVAQLVGIHNHFNSRFYKVSEGHGQLRWGDVSLRVVDKNKIDHDTAVTWVLAGEAVQWLPAHAPADAAMNVVPAQISELLPLGEISVCRMAVLGTSDVIQLNLPTALWASQGLHQGDTLRLSFPLDAVHIMPLKPA
jgi:molybdate transport system ATP-binding protein